MSLEVDRRTNQSSSVQAQVSAVVFVPIGGGSLVHTTTQLQHCKLESSHLHGSEESPAKLPDEDVVLIMCCKRKLTKPIGTDVILLVTILVFLMVLKRSCTSLLLEYL
ncbi:hypothetical protein GUJ93_ZPchr0004g38852 [Zizania palustris]|uniref:Uncharacterized protein n=1 Tax=Zizania palustris TaxID=103762 RepID=A0A8J5SAI8_ZIZPA|nr:hypothetical protein GUJ93_ZPchr0004g38852 [Zizania palustris]